MKSEVLNNTIGSPYDFEYPRLTQQEETAILASIFEQLLIFDKLTITTSRINFALAFLIAKIGINNVERLVESGYIKFLLWTPMIFTGTGHQREDGTIDESVIYGQPPIAAGSLSDKDLDPERNVRIALSHFNIHKTGKEVLQRRRLDVIQFQMEWNFQVTLQAL